MSVEETVVIHVEIDSDLAADSAKLKTFFAMLDREAKHSSRNVDVLDRNSNKLSRTLKKTDRSATKLTRTLSKLKDGLKKTLSVLANFLSKFGLFSFIGVAIEIALISTALLGVKLALVSGRLAIKAYQSSLIGLGVAAGGVAVVLGSVAAAMRQINEVTLGPDVGGYKKAAQTMRAVLNDSQLSFFGMEGIQTAVTALARGGVSANAGYTQILRQLGNYTSDPKQLADLASVYADINKTGQISGDSLGKLGDINPVLSAGITELTGLSGDDLEKVLGEGGAGIGSEVFAALLAGQAEATDAWEGQLERMNNTVIGTLKGMLPRMFTLFADLGTPFLDTITDTLRKIEFIIEKTVMRIRGAVTGFGLDSFMPALLSGFEKISDWIARLVNEALPKVETWGKTMVSWWDTIRNYFNDMVSIFKPLEEAADVLISVLSPQFGAVFDGFATLIKNFADTLTSNKSAFESFGNAIGRFVTSFFSWFDRANDAFADALPVWTNLLDTLTEDVMPMLGDVFEMLHTASQTILPTVTAALGAIANAFSHIAQAITQILKIPGINLLLGAMLFKTTRVPLMAAARLGGTALGIGGGAAAAGGGISGGAAAAGGGAVASASLFSRFAKARIGIPTHLSSPFAQAGRHAVGAIGGSAIPAAGAATSISGGALLGTVAGSGIGGYAAGTIAGDRIGGAGGIAAGIVSGAAVGAGIGAGIGVFFGGAGAGPGAAIGGGVGAVTGGVGAWFSHRRHDKANAAAERFVDDFYSDLEMSLNKGQGRAALSAAQTEMEDMLKNVGDMAKELGVDETELRKRLEQENSRLDRIVEERSDQITSRTEILSEITGQTASELEHLADVMNVQLGDATANLLDQMIELGLMSEYSMTTAGIQDTVNSLLWENLFGSGSVYEQEYTVPELQDTFNALLNEAYDVKQGGGALTGEMVQNLTKAALAYDQAAYGMEGSDLIEGMLIDFPRIDEILGTEMFTKMMVDLQRTQAAAFDPEQNPAMRALKATTIDEVRAFQGDELGSEGAILSKAAETFAEKVEMLKGVDVKNFDETLNSLITSSRAAVDLALYEDFNIAMGTSIVTIDTFNAALAEVFPSTATTADTGKERGWWDPITGGQTGTRSGGRTRSAGIANTPSKAGSPTGKAPTTINQRLNEAYTLNMNVEGLGLREALAMLEDMAAKMLRNARQRSGASTRIGTGGERVI